MKIVPTCLAITRHQISLKNTLGTFLEDKCLLLTSNQAIMKSLGQLLLILNRHLNQATNNNSTTFNVRLAMTAVEIGQGVQMTEGINPWMRV